MTTRLKLFLCCFQIIDKKCWNHNVQVTENQYGPSTR